jgi:hypothetical protein
MQKTAWVAYVQTIEKIIIDNLGTGDTPDAAICDGKRHGVDVSTHAYAWCARPANKAAPDPKARDKYLAGVNARAVAAARKAAYRGPGASRYDFRFNSPKVRGHD